MHQVYLNALQIPLITAQLYECIVLSTQSSEKLANLTLLFLYLIRSPSNIAKEKLAQAIIENGEWNEYLRLVLSHELIGSAV